MMLIEKRVLLKTNHRCSNCRLLALTIAAGFTGLSSVYSLFCITDAPIGLLAVGETFGEWGSEELEEKLGFVPQGLEKLTGIWSAPMPDYALPGGKGSESMTLSAAAYILSALIGVVVCGGLLYFDRKESRQSLKPLFDSNFLIYQSII